MRWTFFLFLLGIFSLNAQEFKPFSGKLIYSNQPADTAMLKLVPPSQMIVYTNDTLLRIENYTGNLGQQVIVKHMLLNKSYLLLETPTGKYAIQIDNSKKSDTVKQAFTYKKTPGKRKIAGVKAKRLLVSNQNFEKPVEFLYLKDYSPKYLNAFEQFPGLPVHYYVPTADGIFEYTLISIEFMSPDYDLFGIPSDYKRMSFDEFMNEFMKDANMQEEDENQKIPQKK